MKLHLKNFFAALVLIPIISANAGNLQNNRTLSNSEEKTISVKTENFTKIERKDETVMLSLAALKEKYRDFNSMNYFCTDKGREIPSQIVDSNGDGRADELLFLASYSPGEKKTVIIHYNTSGVKKRIYKQRTQAVLGIKTAYKKIDGYYTGGKFTDVDSAIVPKDHFPHDALYRIEGPGWESDLIAYRFYLDYRNRNDITGKKTHQMILQKMGVNDLVSNSKESYTKMLDWGMDIFKVGESLGIGSIAMWSGNKVNTVSSTDKTVCRILADGPISSEVSAEYTGWKVSGKKYNMDSYLTIDAGSRLTRTDLVLNDGGALMCTGLAKHEDCDYITSGKDKSRFGYIALYGKQSLSGDNLGIAVFYNKNDFVKTAEDDSSYIVVLKPTAGRLSYYFAAAWQDEPGGIKNEKEFKKYLIETSERLSSPIKTEF